MSSGDNFTPGLAAIGLFHPQTDENVGSVLRAIFNYRADLLVVESEKKYKLASTDVFNVFSHIPFINSPLKSAIPLKAVPVAVELLDDAESIIDFVHPRSAYYIFGPENGSLGESITAWCQFKIFIPTRQCLNLAHAVSAVLYDRMAKRYKKNYQDYEEFAKPEVREIHITKKLPFFAEDKRHDWVKGKKP